MHRKNLKLYSLRAFESAARHLSFSRAADELAVTHSAISRQIAMLEEQVGVELFLRHRRGVLLTDAGLKLLPPLSRALEEISELLDELALSKTQAVLRVSLTPAFATKWLLPRLSRFREAHPKIEVRLEPSLRLVDFSQERCDMAIRCGRGVWPGLRSDFLLGIEMTPVCSPQLLAGSRPLREPRDLQRFTLIHADIGEEQQIGTEWRSWLTAAGAREIDPGHGLSFRDPGLALQAAIDGLGVAIGYPVLAEDDVAAGRLVRPFATTVPNEFAYFAVCPEGRAGDEKIAAFREWLLKEAAANAAGMRFSEARLRA